MHELQELDNLTTFDFLKSKIYNFAMSERRGEENPSEHREEIVRSIKAPTWLRLLRDELRNLTGLGVGVAFGGMVVGLAASWLTGNEKAGILIMGGSGIVGTILIAIDSLRKSSTISYPKNPKSSKDDYWG